MNENDLREAMRASLTIAPPPMEPAAALTAGRRAVRRRMTLAGAGAAVALVAVAALAVNPGLRLVADGGGGDAPWAGPGTPSALPQPSMDETARDAHARVLYEQLKAMLQAKKLRAELLTAVPAGWSTPTGKAGEGIPRQDYNATVEGDNSGKTWKYLASTAVTKDGGTGRLLAEVHTKENGLPQEPCALARQFRGMGGGCEVVTVGKAKVGVVRQPGTDSRIDQWAAYRHADGIVVYLAQSRNASNGGGNPAALKTLPLTVPQLAALAADARFHLG